MNKSDIVKVISQKRHGIPTDAAFEAVECMLQQMTDHLVKRGRIEFRGFGSFFVRQYHKKFGRNPKTGEITGKTLNTRIVFRISLSVLKRLNKIDKEGI